MLPLIIRQTECTAPCTQFINSLFNVANLSKSLRVLDVMLLSSNSLRTPQKWLFTDVKGFFCAQDISKMALDDLIKAIIGNIESCVTPLDHSEILVCTFRSFRGICNNNNHNDLNSTIAFDDKIRGHTYMLRNI